MVSNGDEPSPRKPKPAWARDTNGGLKAVTGEGMFTRIRTGEWPIVKIDLSEAYANVRSRAKTLRRRRIVTSILATVVMVSLSAVLGLYYVSKIPLPDA